MSRGRRYSGEGKLNIKKVVAVLIALALVIIVVISIAKLLGGNKVESKVVATEYFAAYTEGKWGVIDSKGKEVVTPTYTLENAFLIEFINKWHRGEDLNLNYYTNN